MFRADGRVQHRSCPDVWCPVCSKRVLPGAPIRRDGDALIHGNCWIKRRRQENRGG